MSRMAFSKKVTDFCHFSENGALYLPKLQQRIEPGESVALLGARGTDVSALFAQFCVFDPLHQQSGGDSGRPTIWCVSRTGNLFLEFSALDNFALAEKKVFPYSRMQLSRVCANLKKQFGIAANFNTPLKNLSISERIIIDVLRAYLANASFLVCDNLFSLLENKDRTIFMGIVQAMTVRNSGILYLTTKWESAVQTSSRIVVFSENALLGEVDTQSVVQNPHHLIYLMSGKNLMQQYDTASQTTKMLSMLYTGAELLTNNMELRGALSFVLKNACDLLKSAACSIHLIDDKDGLLHLFSYPDVASSPILTEEFIQSRMQKERASSLYYLNDEDLNFALIFEKSAQSARALMCMPIVSNGSTKGIFTVYFDHSVIYNEEQYLYLKSFCKETAIIIETSRLLGNSVLLQESNHRIKNNLQIIINLISMQKLNAMQNPQISFDSILDSIIGRVQNIANVHEMLSSRKTAASTMDLQKMLTHIVDSISSGDVAIKILCDDIMIPHAKATSISMLINELITNSVKYAFVPPRDQDQILIDCKREDGILRISVSDNGCGFDWSKVDYHNPAGIGFSIVRTIVEMDLHGQFFIESSENGTTATFTASPM